MSEALPSSLSSYRANIIIAIYKLGQKSTTPEIRDYLTLNVSEDDGLKVASNITPMANEKKYISAQKFGTTKKYFLTATGEKVAKSLIDNPGEIHLVTSQRKPRAKEDQQEIPFESLNISATASNLANSLTALIEENQGYRAVLLDVYKLIGKRLGLENQTED